MITKTYEHRLKKNMFRVAILSTITVIIWLGITTYHSLTQSQISPEVKKQLLPLTTSLPVDTINQINQRTIAPEIDWDKINQGDLLMVDKNISSSASAEP